MIGGKRKMTNNDKKRFTNINEKERKQVFHQHGVTLLALIITIIILLILAGITISALTGENGLIKRAVGAKANTLAAEQEEDTVLDELEQWKNNYLGKNGKGRRDDTTSMGGKCSRCSGWSTNTKRIYSRPR